MAPILRNGGSQSPDRWLREPRNNHSEFGTEEQKQKYLVPLLKGEKLGAFAVTEPSAGSDLGNQQTSAVDKGDY